MTREQQGTWWMIANLREQHAAIAARDATAWIGRHWNQAHDPAEPEWIRLRSATKIKLWARALPRLAVRAIEWFDWDRLRVNVAHHVAPEIVRWK